MDMKRLSARNRENIVKEIKAHSQMEHPNIIRMLDFMERGQYIYILLEYAPNGNLFHFINNKQMSPELICKLFVQICLAIEHIHSKGFIHRDIKPENILLDANFNALLCDFGWTASFNDVEYRYQTAGTYEYMSPEALQNRAQNKESDIWALGVLLYELHHIQEPFPGRSSREVLESIRRKKVEFFRDVPPEARNLILEILAIEPEKRPPIRKILSSPYVQRFYKGPLGPNMSSASVQHPTAMPNFVSNRTMTQITTKDESPYKSDPQPGVAFPNYQSQSRSQAVKQTLHKLELGGIVTKKDVVNQQPNPLVISRDLKLNLNNGGDTSPITSISPVRRAINLGDSPINAISVQRDHQNNQLRMHTPAQQSNSPFKLAPKQVGAENHQGKPTSESYEIQSLGSSQIRQPHVTISATGIRHPQTFASMAREVSTPTKPQSSQTPIKSTGSGGSHQSSVLQTRISESSQAIANAKQVLQNSEKLGSSVPSRISPNPVISVTEWHGGKDDQTMNQLDRSGISGQTGRVFTFHPSTLQASISNGSISNQIRPLASGQPIQLESNNVLKTAQTMHKVIPLAVNNGFLELGGVLRPRASHELHMKTMSIASTTNDSNKTTKADQTGRQSGEYVIITSNAKSSSGKPYDETINRGSAPMVKDEDASGSTLRLSETLQNKKVLKRTISEVESETSRSNSPGQRFVVEPRKTFDLKLSATDKHSVTAQNGQQQRGAFHIQYGMPSFQPSRQEGAARTSYQDMTIQQKNALKPLDFGTALSQSQNFSSGTGLNVLRSTQFELMGTQGSIRSINGMGGQIRVIGSGDSFHSGVGAAVLNGAERSTSVSRNVSNTAIATALTQPRPIAGSFHNIYTDNGENPAPVMKKESSVEPLRPQVLRGSATAETNKRQLHSGNLADTLPLTVIQQPSRSTTPTLPSTQKSSEGNTQIQRLSSGITLISNTSRAEPVSNMNRNNAFAKPLNQETA